MRAALLIAACAALPLRAGAAAPAPAFAIRAVTPSRIVCAGADTMQELVERWAAAFGARAAGRRITVERGLRLSADGLTALLAGRVDCVTFARELFPAETAAYEAAYGVRPRPIPVANGSFATLHATHAIAIYVNAANPLAAASLPQLARVFSASDAPPTHWGQLGLGGRWRRAPIHVYGMAPYRASGNPPGIVNYLRATLLHGREFRADLRVVPGAGRRSALARIVQSVAADPYGIGYSGFGFAATGAKALALARGPGLPAVAGTEGTVADRRYPLARTVYLLFAPSAGPRPAADARKDPADPRKYPADPFEARFARFALSTAGQALVAGDAWHFIPLTRGQRGRARTAVARPLAPSSAARLARGLPRYRPAPVGPAPDAAYLTSEGAVAIVGYNDMRTPLAAIDILFAASHPGLRFALRLEGTRTAPAALERGTSLLAPMGAPIEDAPLAAYRRAVGANPVAIVVAHDALDPAARSSPLGVFVARDNPLDRLSLDELARVLAPPGGAAPARRWAGLGESGPWRARPIHVYGLAPRTALGRFLTRDVFGGRPFAAGYRGFAESRAAISHAIADPDALAIADLNQRDPRLKLVALARCGACRASLGSIADLIADRYPLDRHLLIYLRRAPRGGVDPLAREYLRLVLSREGQTAIAAAPPHYLPLDAADAAASLAVLRLRSQRRR